MTSREPLGLESGTVVVVPYDPRWPALFEQAAHGLRAALGRVITGIHHVGSTSVPGMCAKPVIDILVSIPRFKNGLALVPELQRLGYEHRPKDEIPDRHYFRRRRGTARTHHLSLAEPESRHHRATLAFRDALRSDQGIAEQYAELKLRLARQYPFDCEAYLEGKSSFVDRVLASTGFGAGESA